MKTAKYRAKRLDTQEWVEGFFYKIAGRSYITLPPSSSVLGQGLVGVEVDPDTISVWTTKNDKNDNPIFSGCLILFHSHKEITKKEYWDPIYEVTFDGFEFGLKHSGGGLNCDSGMFKLCHTPDRFEIIGNIH